MNYGLLFVVTTNQKKVLATADGTIMRIEKIRGHGLSLLIKHNLNQSPDLISAYLGLQATQKKIGDTVIKGEIIGIAHDKLLFSIFQGAYPLNPQPFLITRIKKSPSQKSSARKSTVRLKKNPLKLNYQPKSNQKSRLMAIKINPLEKMSAVVKIQTLLIFFDRCVDDFYHYIHFEKGLAAATVSAYLGDVRLFHDEVRRSLLSEKQEHNEAIQEMDDENISWLLSTVMKEQLIPFVSRRKQLKVKDNSIRRELSSLRNFFIFLEKRNYITDSLAGLVENYRVPQTPREVLSEAEINKLLTTCGGQDKASRRNYLLLKMLYALGLRVSEVVKLELNDFNLNEGFLLVKGKGGKATHPAALRWLNR